MKSRRQQHRIYATPGYTLEEVSGISTSHYQFGDWRIEPHLNRLSQNDIEHQVEPLAMDVLEYLLVRAGEVVSTDELLDQVWAGRHADPAMVAKRISQLRGSLGDDAKNSRYISTVPKRGYCAIAQVKVVNSSSHRSSTRSPFKSQIQGEDTLHVTNRPVANGKPQLLRRRYRSALWGSTFVVVLGLLIWVGVSNLDGDSTQQIHSIAVLPLDNLSGDSSQQYVADGMTEEITTELGKLSQLHVISRTSSMQYKDDRPSLKAIAKDLNVDTIIEGSVAREAGRFRVTVQLIDARTDSHIWAHSFDREVSSVLALRSDVAREIASHLNLRLSDAEQVALSISRHIDESAYDAYLRGLSHIGDTERFMSWAPLATEEMQRAVSLDPNFAEAWAQLALIETIKAVWINRKHFATVREHANKAISIDSNLALAHTVLGYVHLLNDWDPAGAETAFKRAVQLSPNDRRTLQGYLVNLRTQERTTEAQEVSKKLVNIAPLDFHQRAERIKYLYSARLYERAITEADSVRLLDPEYRGFDEAAAYHQLGRFEDAYLARLAAYRRCGKPCIQAQNAAENGWLAGGYEGMLRALQQLQFQEPSERNAYWIHAQLGDVDKAFEHLERLVGSRAPWLVGIRYHPDFDLLRFDSRFDALLEQMDLPQLPENPARLADVARLLAFRGRAAEAIDHLNRAIAASPEDPRLPRWFESMAWAQFATGNYTLAAKWADRVLEYKINSHAAAFAHLLRAASYAYLVRLDVARSALQQTNQSWPSPLQTERDLKPLFIGGDQSLRDRYMKGLNKAGLEN